MSNQPPNLTQNLVFWGTTAFVVGYAIVLWRQKRLQNKIPTNWQRVGEISQLIIYPLKSGRGENIKEADCTELGLKTTDGSPDELRKLRDRFFIIYKADTGAFITCRNFPALLLVKTNSAGENAVIFSAPGMSPLRLEIPGSSTPYKKHKISMWFGEELDATDCGDEAAKWICDYLKKEDVPLRLGCHLSTDNDERRNTDNPPWDKFKKYYKRLRNDYTGAFADLASYMLLSESSLSDLKSKLPDHLQKIPAKQFRPNIVVQGSKPYEEDNWDWIKFGDEVIMRGFKPCTRCTVTTMDPETGIRESDLQPLVTLKKFRQLKDPAAKELEGDAPVMGLYMGLNTVGRVKVGDPVYIGKS